MSALTQALSHAHCKPAVAALVHDDRDTPQRRYSSISTGSVHNRMWTAAAAGKRTWSRHDVFDTSCRALILCEEIGLWGTAHTDGTVELRLLPTGAPDERYTLEIEPGKPVPSVNIPQFRAPFCVRLLSQSPLLFGKDA